MVAPRSRGGNNGGRRPPSARRIALAPRRIEPNLQSCVSSVTGGVAAVVEVPEGATAKEMIESAKHQLSTAAVESDADRKISISISTVCNGVSSSAGAFEEAKQVSKCAAQLSNEDAPLLAADDLGAGRLLLAAPDGDQTRRFADDTLGSLVDPDDPAMVTLLMTMGAFYSHSRSIRQSVRLARSARKYNPVPAQPDRRGDRPGPGIRLRRPARRPDGVACTQAPGSFA